MSVKNKVVKSVSFNRLNDEDNKMLKHFSRRNFSGYVKKLIMQDMIRKEEEKGKEQSKVKPEKPVSASEELQQMKQQKREQQGAPPAPNVFIKKQEHR